MYGKCLKSLDLELTALIKSNIQKNKSKIESDTLVQCYNNQFYIFLHSYLHYIYVKNKFDEIS